MGYHPGYFGKVGMRYFHLTRNQYWKPTINLDKLWSLVPVETRDEYVSGKKTDTAPVLDLLPLGYSKVLGKGRIPEIPIVVRARYFSKEAERKIKEAGGVVELAQSVDSASVGYGQMQRTVAMAGSDGLHDTITTTRQSDAAPCEAHEAEVVALK